MQLQQNNSFIGVYQDGTITICPGEGFSTTRVTILGPHPWSPATGFVDVTRGNEIEVPSFQQRGTLTGDVITWNNNTVWKRKPTMMPAKPATPARAPFTGASPASARELMGDINRTCRQKGGKYATYSCKQVSWDDVNRGTVGGALSCWGANITDTYLKSKSGAALFTLRPDNWNEKLGKVSAQDVALIVGNHQPAGQLRPVTLEKFLSQLGEFGQYANLAAGHVLFDEALDSTVSVRFQTTFLPIADEDKGTLEFCTEAYNYNTQDDQIPRNMVVLATTQGVAIQQDGRGKKQLFHHAPSDSTGEVDRFWLEAERSSHSVGGPQRESEAERNDALKRGKATAAVIGTKALETRFNVLMTIQIPLQQPRSPARPAWTGASPSSAAAFVPLAPPPLAFSATAPATFAPGFDLGAAPIGAASASAFGAAAAGGLFGAAPGAVPATCAPAFGAASASAFGAQPFGAASASAFSGGLFGAASAPAFSGGLFGAASFGAAPAGGLFGSSGAPLRTGTANAARVSRGTRQDTLTRQQLNPGLQSARRHPSEHVTVTIVIYNTVAGGVPTEDDIMAAVDDMEMLYAACNWTGNLGSSGADFMKSELTVKDAVEVSRRVTNFDQFPV
ncbi:hypothetical protein CYMTET_6399 [Cymbomonas tetramitiformis]|uniref:Uncharacterized protein n=1 Tax=Cymbomonas tetramitiformis TaxID=36881 RepID=A0AAE0LIH6_9CHLO|nr:hypothetical protein CYMTET_7056 [Cymbomonas tetramitiformis]KAK3286009.1 hypothetical protein CYMTET_6399 [Cymbomonas tetramitiformis]